MKANTNTARPVNGTGYTAGKSPRDYLRERAASVRASRATNTDERLLMAFNLAAFVTDYEDGKPMEFGETIAGFQRLVDTGLAWQLQGHYGRTAAALIDAGLVRRRDN